MPNLRYSEVTCPICLYILIEPVTLPCKHEMCLGCFQESIQSSNIACPLCRLRISIWSRRAAREKCLVNVGRWNEIKKAFPEEIERRLAGEDDCDVPFESTSNPVPLSKPGEIRKEYEEKLLEFQLQEALIREQEERASEELIKKIQHEEMQEFPITCQQISTGSKINVDLIPSCSSRSTTEHNPLISNLKEKKKPRSSSAESGDSIRPELQYFKPIKTAPKTPPKPRPDGQLIEAPVMCIKPRKLLCTTSSAPSGLYNSLCNKSDVILNDSNGKGVKSFTKSSPKNNHGDLCRQNHPLHTLSLNSPPLLTRKRNRRGMSSYCVQNIVTPENFNIPDQNLVVHTQYPRKGKESRISVKDHSSENGSMPEGVFHDETEPTVKLRRHNMASKTQWCSRLPPEKPCETGEGNKSSSLSKNMEGNLISVKSQMPSHCSCGNTSSPPKINARLKRCGRPPPNVLNTAVTNKKNKMLRDCMKCQLTSIIFSSDNGNMVNICNYHLASEEQVKKDFAYAVQLQNKYDREAKKPTTCCIKSDYNLRNRCNKTKHVSKQ